MHFNFYEDILDIIQIKVNEITDKDWDNDECKPEFKVSLLNENINNQKILLTVTHLGNSFTETLFPRDDSHYGYDTLESFMVDLYNRTM